MKTRMIILAQGKRWVLLLVVLCAFTLPLASAQTDRQTGEGQPGIPPGYTIIEGDIQVPISVADSLRQRAPVGPQATFDTNLWPNGIIPFEFETTCAATSSCNGALPSGCVSQANQTAMLNAMAVLEAVANVDFQLCPGNNCAGGHIRIRDSTNDTTVGLNNTCQDNSRNSSPVGRQGNGQQFINIVSWGARFIIVHELLHSLGFFHEHTRPDRNTYVDVASLCSNVQGGCMGDTYTDNFPIESGATAYGYYDFDSVMHYGQCSFSRNPGCPMSNSTFPDGGITVRVQPPYNTQLSPDGIAWQQAIGQRQRLSELDRATVSFLYPFADWRFVDCNYNGSNGSPNGTFLRPYTSFTTATANTPAGGTLWVLSTCTFPDRRTYDQRVTVRVAPGVTATLGD